MSGAAEGGSAGIDFGDAEAKRECEEEGVKRRPVEPTPVEEDIPQVRPVGVSRRGR